MGGCSSNMVDKLSPEYEKGATLGQRSCGCQFIQACLFAAARRRLNISRAQTLISNGGWCLLVYYVAVDTHPCCVTSFVYSEDRNDRAVAWEWPLFSCRRVLWPSIDWLSSFVSSPAIYLLRKYLPSHFLSRLDPTISPIRVRSFCETTASATYLPRQVATTTLTMYMD